MINQEQQDERNQIRLYEIIRGEEDTPFIPAEAVVDDTLLSIKREVAAGLDSPLFPQQPSYNNNLNSQEVKKQNGNT